ncbi:dihydrofolate reductase family protein [Nocardioides panacis]|nr:dihydrofolate reductase family protein [Nocardioides panacis]
MSTLTVDLFSSLDGFGGAEGWPGYWGKEGPELMAWLEEKLAEDHVLVMGAHTYRTMSEIVAAQEDPTFARMAEIPKVVFSTTLDLPLAWENTELVAEDAVAAMARMKQERSAPMRTMGSISLSTSLLRAGLVDYLQVTVFPVVTGQSGREPLFAGGPDLDLELVDSRTFDGRAQLLGYVPTLH